MSKVLPFSKPNLRNATHLQVMRNCVEYANTLSGISDQRFSNVKATYLAALDREDDLFQTSQGSKYTKQIEDADKTRDRAYSIICNVSAAFADGYGPDELVSASPSPTARTTTSRSTTATPECSPPASGPPQASPSITPSITSSREYFELSG